jgi:hypothetical protein
VVTDRKRQTRLSIFNPYAYIRKQPVGRVER